MLSPDPPLCPLSRPPSPLNNIDGTLPPSPFALTPLNNVEGSAVLRCTTGMLPCPCDEKVTAYEG